MHITGENSCMFRPLVQGIMMKGREVKLKQNDMTNIDMRQHAIKGTMKGNRRDTGPPKREPGRQAAWQAGNMWNLWPEGGRKEASIEGRRSRKERISPIEGLDLFSQICVFSS